MNLANYMDITKLQDVTNVKKVFFYRICGTGMGAAACLLKESGLEVAGADRMFYPPMSTYLESSGIDIFNLEDENLKDIIKGYDLIVVGNVVARQSDDARMLEELGIPFCSFPAAIGAFVLKNKKVVGVSGTHGKTTTTYFGVQLFEKLGMNPGYLIGGVMDERPPARTGEGEYFFIESDEYDSAYFEKYSKFRSYFINTLIITSLEFDHADIFESIEDIKDEFKAILPEVDEVIACSEWESIKDLKTADKSWSEYSRENVKIINVENGLSTFSMKCSQGEHTFKTNLMGMHNILNLTSIIIVALKAGKTVDEIQEGILDLKMVQRRQEVKGEFNESPIIDDFAHHPTAVTETVSAISFKYPGKKIHAYLEPGSATARSDLFQERFVDSLKDVASATIIKPMRPTTAKGQGDLDVEKLKADLDGIGVKTSIVTELDMLISLIKENSNKDSIQLVMSNSSCLGLWSSEFVKTL
ncbi:putative UDP-N-acetylmuramate:L-alanyl-gamma-D-glutamyl-meso-diaminopimelate ligase [Halobacteriovorax sp. BALOs_7]|uniref:Mur ligase family protein n=1 Tax=Halobacteriovorax sp. BALOs_7 TaxID=2109558 RepID=UPI000EA0029A|nr:Mur ligase family protein [Halobacteriovorax sp. BALOs_7]AYF45580.1 putative UDP-N-acetylmuramate:L-alanyl-gamma-D-glutamyl-meso-diaminopimelate ligase [Halobacteriovorax sp. BALOs_7]